MEIEVVPTDLHMIVKRVRRERVPLEPIDPSDVAIRLPLRSNLIEMAQLRARASLLHWFRGAKALMSG
jgi:uncharacterized membrane protein